MINVEPDVDGMRLTVNLPSRTPEIYMYVYTRSVYTCQGPMLILPG